MRFNKPTRLDAGIFLVSFAVLLLELLLTRIFSVTLFYHLSFMVVSLAMLGFAAGGLAANLWSNRFRESALLGQLSVLSLLFALTTVVAVFVALRVSVSLYPTRGNLVRLAFIYLVCVVPFFLSGLVIALLMAHRAERANRLSSRQTCGPLVRLTMPDSARRLTLTFAHRNSTYAMTPARRLPFLVSTAT